MTDRDRAEMVEKAWVAAFFASICDALSLEKLFAIEWALEYPVKRLPPVPDVVRPIGATFH
jgi:hypothetical protein